MLMPTSPVEMPCAGDSPSRRDACVFRSDGWARTFVPASTCEPRRPRHTPGTRTAKPIARSGCPLFAYRARYGLGRNAGRHRIWSSSHHPISQRCNGAADGVAETQQSLKPPRSQRESAFRIFCPLNLLPRLWGAALNDVALQNGMEIWIRCAMFIHTCSLKPGALDDSCQGVERPGFCLSGGVR